MRSLLRLYPRAWRARYGEELGDLLAGKRLTPRLVLDLLAGALDARLNPQLPTRAAGTAAGSSGGGTMVGGLSFRCASAGHMTRREALQSALLLVGLTFVLTLLHVWLKRVYGSTPWVEGLGSVVISMPALVWVLVSPAGWKHRSPAARAILVAFVLAVLFLAGWLAAVT